MQLGFELIFLLVGLLLGAGSVWLISTFRIGALRSQLTTGSQVEITELRERLRGHEVSLSESLSRVRELETRKNEL
jgi:hypothetical protein